MSKLHGYKYKIYCKAKKRVDSTVDGKNKNKLKFVALAIDIYYTDTTTGKKIRVSVMESIKNLRQLPLRNRLWRT